MAMKPDVSGDTDRSGRLLVGDSHFASLSGPNTLSFYVWSFLLVAVHGHLALSPGIHSSNGR